MKQFRLNSISQASWVTLTVALIFILMSIITTTFFTSQNIFNISRNFSFVAIATLGQALVLITGGIDLSVGSVMGLSAIVTAQSLEGGSSLAFGVFMGLFAALICGLVNGILIAKFKLSPFIVTLGMLSIARSVTLILAGNKMVYSFGPDEKLFLQIGGGEFLHIPNSVWMLLVLTVLFWFVLKRTIWARHLYAIGGSERSAILTGISVRHNKVSVYVLSSLLAALCAIMQVGWLGSATTALGSGYELMVIAAAVIGGVSLNGGHGGAIGVVVGSALIELIRNSLLLLGVDPYWQGSFVGLVIIFAVLVSTKDYLAGEK